jgi:hypothetical protein
MTLNFKPTPTSIPLTRIWWAEGHSKARYSITEDQLLGLGWPDARFGAEHRLNGRNTIVGVFDSFEAAAAALDAIERSEI